MRGSVAWVLGLAWAMSLLGTPGTLGLAGHDDGAASHKCLGTEQVNKEPKFNGAPSWCGLHSAGSPIMAGICLIWDRCGGLSPRCESFLQSLSHFLYCSLLAGNWAHPEKHGSVQALPICAAFCDQWFSACRDDLTCGRNWLFQPGGGSCEGGCLTFDQTKYGSNPDPQMLLILIWSYRPSWMPETCAILLWETTWLLHLLPVPSFSSPSLTQSLAQRPHSAPPAKGGHCLDLEGAGTTGLDAEHCSSLQWASAVAVAVAAVTAPRGCRKLGEKGRMI
ncbi:retbindin isoform X3 [Monodelphis domestica]|nr:retbindin isoform X3 [Monodelphis domestica]XP_007488532.1 retbindin isoform X3 [Monodelphis domestica]